MPRYPVTTNVNKQQMDKIDSARNLKGLSRYMFLREALLHYAEACIKEKKTKNEREKSIGEDSREANNDGEDLD